MKGMDGGPPPTADLLAKFRGGEAIDFEKPGMVLHLLYGTVAGAVLAIGLPLIGFGFESLGVAIGFGLVYGLVLMVGGMIFWMNTIIGMSPDKEMVLTFATVHVVYGVILGAVLGSGIFA
ncbi:hypothetical protein [Halodesulfurarchaeum sp.]|uniref:hypothetical protein n=1 Tax=Halodesulfurarchaeum sp. TaxID=1980530 RepID=UPI002FC292BE